MLFDRRRENRASPRAESPETRLRQRCTACRLSMSFLVPPASSSCISRRDREKYLIVVLDRVFQRGERSRVREGNSTSAIAIFTSPPSLFFSEFFRPRIEIRVPSFYR